MKYKRIKKEVLEFRKKGYSLSELSKHFNIAKSTAGLWVRGIILSKEEKEDIYKRCHPPRKQSIETRLKISKTRKELIKEGLLTMEKAIFASHKIHTSSEKQFKPKLEKYFATSNLLPSKINGSWFDFVNQDYIIEYTQDWGKGLTYAINRLEKVKEDSRKKFLITVSKYFGINRRKRLENTNSVFIPVSIIEMGNPGDAPGPYVPKTQILLLK